MDSVFNIVQCLMVLIAVAESTIVHLLLKTQRDRIAIQIDRVLRVTVPFLMYPVITLSMILWGLEQWSLCPDSNACGVGTSDPRYLNRASLTYRSWTMSEIGAWVGGVGVVITVLISVLWISYRFRYVAREQVFSILDLIETAICISSSSSPNDTPHVHDASSASTSMRDASTRRAGGDETGLSHAEKMAKRSLEWVHATERVFNAFDLDDSGSIDVKELREICQSMYPHAHGVLMRSALQMAREYADASGAIDKDSFGDAISVIMEHMGERMKRGDSGARPLSVKRSSVKKLVADLNFWVGEKLADGRENHVALLATQTNDLSKEFVKRARGLSRQASRVGTISSFRSSLDARPPLNDPGRVYSNDAAYGAADVSIASMSGDEAATHDVDATAVSPRSSPSLSPSKLELASDHGAAGAKATAIPAAVVMLRTSSGGWQVGKVSAKNVPLEVEVALRSAQEDANMLVSTLIARLVSRGFTIASQSAAGQSEEMLFTLVGPAAPEPPADSAPFRLSRSQVEIV